MSRVRITTPVPDHSGVVGAVFITDGVAFADTEVHAAEIAYCIRNGYTVEDVEDVQLRRDREELGFTPAEIAEMEADDVEDRLPRRNGSAEAWRAYAIAHGIPAGEANELTRDQLVERFASTEETEA